MQRQLNKYSSRITQPKSQGASQAMLYGTGLTEADMQKPQVGIASVWYEGNPCNMHLNNLAERVKEGVVAAGMVGMRFNTIGVSDGISMGTERHELLAAIARPDRRFDRNRHGRPVVRRQHLAARLRQEHARLPDRHGPAQPAGADGLRRHDPAGPLDGEKLDIVSAFQCYGQYHRRQDRRSSSGRQIVRHSCPGAGACGGMYTANTMASAIEALGMSLPYSGSIPAEDPAKLDECCRAGAAIRLLLELDLKPRDIMTRRAFENAMVVVMALGGSTNAVLHLIAMARAVEVPLTIDDFQTVSDRVPFLADLKPSGKYVQEDLHPVGGTPAVMKYLLEKGLLDGDCLTVTGKTLAENLRDLPGLKPGSRSSSRSKSRSSRPATFRFCAATWRPTEPWPRSPARKARVSAGRPRSTTREEDMLARAGAQGDRQRATWSSSATKAPRAGPACPRCSRPPRPSWEPAWAATWP